MLLRMRDIFLYGIMLLLVFNIFICFRRAIKGPRITDRLVAINMIGTNTISIIAILAIVLDQSYLIDICLIYAMISFLSVIVLTKVYMGVYNEKRQKEKQKKKKGGELL